MKGIEWPKFAIVHRDRQTPAFPTGEEAVEDELHVSCRFVKLSHEIVPAILSVGTDETIEFFPDNQSAVILQSL